MSLQPQPIGSGSAVSYAYVTTLQAVSSLDTPSLFNTSWPAQVVRPLDEFIKNTNSINVVYLGAPDPLQPELGTLVLLGYMSAVESFFRSMVRGLINTDAHTRLIAEPLTLSFGAALHHTRSLMPEALLEGLSFAGLRGIESTLRDIIGIKGVLPTDVSGVLQEYGKICEIRHCCVHRFGKLGANNAIKLGLSEHSIALEKPFSPTKSDLEQISDLLRTVVKTVNNFVFKNILERTIGVGPYEKERPYQSWHWNYIKDRKRFLAYYFLFSSRIDNPPSPEPKLVYDSFRSAAAQHRAAKIARMGSRRPT